MDNPTKERFFDATSNRTYEPGQLSKKELDKRLDSGDVLIRLEEALNKSGSDPVHLVLGKKGDILLKELDTVIVPYREGGHRIYEGKYFIKQARFGTFSNGNKWRDNPLTQGVFESKREADQFVIEHEAARQAVLAFRKGTITEEELTKALNKIDIEDIDEWNRL